MEPMTVYEIAGYRLGVIQTAIDTSADLANSTFGDDEIAHIGKLIVRTIDDVFPPEAECPVPSCPTNKTPRTSAEAAEKIWKGILNGKPGAN